MTDNSPDLRPNLPEWTVSELSGALKRTVEDAYGHVRVRGEISGYRGPHSSGHAYFALKDEGARIDAVVWKQAFAKMRNQAAGRSRGGGDRATHHLSGSFQLPDRHREPGTGGPRAPSWRSSKSARRSSRAEGLFDEARKQLLPFLPDVIGVVTSPTGAVIRDILHRLEDRFPRRVIVWPVRVQGEGAAEEVAAAITGFNDLPEGGKVPRPDLLIVAAAAAPSRICGPSTRRSWSGRRPTA